jgi:hypothetical protein
MKRFSAAHARCSPSSSSPTGCRRRSYAPSGSRDVERDRIRDAILSRGWSEAKQVY